MTRMRGAFALLCAAVDLRSRAAARHGSFSRPDQGTYPWLSRQLYGFGRARPSREVIEAFLGRGLTTDTLLRDMER